MLCYKKGDLTFRYKTAAGRNRTLDLEIQNSLGTGRAKVRIALMAHELCICYRILVCVSELDSDRLDMLLMAATKRLVTVMLGSTTCEYKCQQRH